MERLDFNKILDEYLTTGHMNAEDYYQLDEYQQRVIQEIKKAYKRLNKNEDIQIHFNS